jgi:hypothetical protein
MSEKYFSFLLRLWRTGSRECPIWRIMLEDPHTREVFGFDSLEAFLIHLQSLAGEISDPDDQNQVSGEK